MEDWKKINSNVARNVREFREARGWSEDKLGKLINVNKSTVCRIENNKLKRVIDSQHLKNLAKVFEVNPDVLTETNADYHYKLNELEQRLRRFENGNQLLLEAKLFVEYSTGRGKIELAKALQMLGAVHFVREEYQSAFECYDRALDEVESNSFSHSVFYDHLRRNKVDSLLRLGKFIELQKFALDILDDVVSIDSKALILIALGTSFYKIKDYVSAESNILSGLSLLSNNSENIVHLARANELLATVKQKAKCYSESLMYANKSLSLAKKCGDRLTELYCLRVIGEVKLEQNQKIEARNYFCNALEIAKESKTRNVENCLLKFSLSLCEDNLDKKYEQLMDIIQLAEEVEIYKVDLAEIYTTIADVAFELQKYKDSQRYYRSALKIFHE